MLRVIFLGGDGKWAMNSHISSYPSILYLIIAQNTSNFQMLGMELQLPDQLVWDRLEPDFESRETSELQLSKSIQVVQDKQRPTEVVSYVGHARTILV